MSAYLVVNITMHDPSWLESYSAGVPGIVQKHGGEYLAVSETIRRVEGSGDLTPNFHPVAARDRLLLSPSSATVATGCEAASRSPTAYAAGVA